MMNNNKVYNGMSFNFMKFYLEFFMEKGFDERFLRHLGIMSPEQQELIKKTSVAIGGLGLGGSVFINLVRMGFEKFNVADPDTYETSNINRQRLAKDSNVSRRKDESLLDEAYDINPNIKVRCFKDGVNEDNVRFFLKDVDYAIDVVDVFALKEKLAFNEAAFNLKIPMVSIGAIGMSASVVYFDQKGPSFSELTGMKVEDSYEENITKFVDFLTPEIPEYMREQLELALAGQGSIPFIVGGVELSAACCANEVVKHILKIGKNPVAPLGIHLDLANLKISTFTADYRERVLILPKMKGVA
ncbi:MAG: ThiF family adenylyltransferase [Bacteriovoracaceae bacterium]|nr:ThiF family adenylyltransferase [Bacteriovoracaceae bacterium]